MFTLNLIIYPAAMDHFIFYEACLSAWQDHQFGPHEIRASEIFASTQLSFAFVNLKPVVPGMRTRKQSDLPAKGLYA